MISKVNLFPILHKMIQIFIQYITKVEDKTLQAYYMDKLQQTF